MRSLLLVSGSNSDSGTSPSSLAGEFCKLVSDRPIWVKGLSTGVTCGNCLLEKGIIVPCIIGAGIEMEEGGTVYWSEAGRSLGSRFVTVEGTDEADIAS